MIFGMPTALFPVLALDVFGTGPAGLGLMAAAPAAGAFLGALFSGWISGVRRTGRAIIAAVVAWGLAITAFGLVTVSFPLALFFLALAGAADVFSAVFRSTLVQFETPDRLRGRVMSIHTLVVTSGPRLGDIEAAVVASLIGPQLAVVTGGIAVRRGRRRSWRGGSRSSAGTPRRTAPASVVGGRLTRSGSPPHRFGMGVVDGIRPVADGTQVLIPGALSVMIRARRPVSSRRGAPHRRRPAAGGRDALSPPRVRPYPPDSPTRRSGPASTTRWRSRSRRTARSSWPRSAARSSVFDSLTRSRRPTLFANLNVNVHNCWDRGMMGLAIDPGYASGDPYVYVLYAYNHILGDRRRRPALADRAAIEPWIESARTRRGHRPTAASSPDGCRG